MAMSTSKIGPTGRTGHIIGFMVNAWLVTIRQVSDVVHSTGAAQTWLDAGRGAYLELIPQAPWALAGIILRPGAVVGLMLRLSLCGKPGETHQPGACVSRHSLPRVGHRCQG
jgi:hypothetical protein